MLTTLNEIDYGILYRSKRYYSDIGFTYVELPWLIPWDPMLITTTPEKIFSINFNKNLIGSGEQSFLNEVLCKQIIPHKYYQTITPCFRKEKYDELHQEQFIKLELFYFWYNDDYTLNYKPEFSDVRELGFIINKCYNFFSLIHYLEFYKKTGNYPNLELIDTENNSYDINMNGIEIGSYGIRNYNGLNWIYGTGLALPRFTQAINYKNNL